MIGWIFKKNEALAPDSATGEAARPAATGPAEKAEVPLPTLTEWQQRLQAASGDDAALLALARDSAPLDVKLAAVGALATEAALKLAEREFRSHDRRVHRLAKQRHGALVARREAGDEAARLIVAAQALIEEPLIAVNRLVELDRAWQAVDSGLIEAAQRAEFDDLLARLSARARESADEALKLKRWTAQAQLALAQLSAACLEAAPGTLDRSRLAAARGAALQAIEAAPQNQAGTALADALGTAAGTAAQLEERLAVLEELLQASTRVEHDPAPEPASADDGFTQAAPAPTSPGAVLRWQQFPPLADARLEDALRQRFQQWQRAQDDARQAQRAHRRDQAKTRQHAARHERTETLAGVLERAEAALADGHLADAHKQLVELDDMLHGGVSAGALRSRIDQLQAGYAQLKGWQHWGGGRARDELVLQAEALAAATSGEADARNVKLTTRQQAEIIDDMRARWKELDRLGGATSRSLWQRFEAALKLAYQPVAAQVAAQRAAREQNLMARQQLIEVLDALVLPGGEGSEGAEAAPDWRSLAGALDHFQTEWRKLGPIEHTVPHKARDKLVERMDAAVARLKAPLNEARRAARLTREQLIARASALGAEVNTGASSREVVDRVRALQAEWQWHARALPLARSDENALWTAFKAAIDGIFSARDAVFHARDAEARAHGAERVALLERLEALTADTVTAELKRTLAEVEAAWQRAGPASRNEAQALDARFRHAREAARLHLAGTAHRSWQATCEALAAKLALCEEAESSDDREAAQALLARRWPSLPALPAAWEQALSERARAPRAGAPKLAASADELLLQAEAAWGLSSPPAFEAARRQLKLQALKSAMEGRRPTVAAPLSPDHLLLALLSQTGLDDPQRERLGAVLDALRRRGPADARQLG